MLLGEYNCALDAKGRLVIPARLRAELGSTIVLTRGYEPCLVLYGQDAWALLAQKVAEVSTTNDAVRAYRRLFFGGASEAVPDRLGRILLPAFLREYASLDAGQEVTLVGANTCVEIWQPSRYRQVLEASTQHMAEILAALAQLGI